MALTGGPFPSIEVGRSPLSKPIGAIVATRFNRTKEAKDCVRQTRDAFPQEMLQTVVRESARLGEAFSYARTIIEHDPEGMAAADYRAVADELLARWKVSLPVSTRAVLAGSRDAEED